MVVAFVLVPSFWFWATFDLFAALLVAYDCIGEWYLHHHPAGRAKREKDVRHNSNLPIQKSLRAKSRRQFFNLQQSFGILSLRTM
jgi:hypothetical protein